MCGRYTLTSQEGLVLAFELASGEPAEASAWWRPRFNIAPTQPAPVILLRDGVRVLELMRWGLVPPWSASLADGARMINARSEGIATKPAFRDAVKARRCLVPADGFFEWRGAGKAKQPIYLHPVPRRPVAFAGLWERWRAPDATWVTTFTIITGPPNDLVAPIHDRMPVVLDPAAYAPWLAPGPLAPEALAALLAVPPVGDWQATPVDRRVGSPAHDDPGCVEPVADAPGDDGDDAGDPRQRSLF
jgi:putative SOS response-associated peptidase YedK